jgi:hypothetical protein
VKWMLATLKKKRHLQPWMDMHDGDDGSLVNDEGNPSDSFSGTLRSRRRPKQKRVVNAWLNSLPDVLDSPSDDFPDANRDDSFQSRCRPRQSEHASESYSKKMRVD